MLDIEKFRLGVDEEVYDTIYLDCLNYVIIKKNGEANINKFMNRFVKLVLPSQVERLSYCYEQAKINYPAFTKTDLKPIFEQMILETTSAFSGPLSYGEAKKGKPKYLSFSLEEDNLSILENALTSLSYVGSYASLFRQFLYLYVNYPAFVRERLLFSDVSDVIKEAIKKNKKLRFDINASTNNVTTPIYLQVASDRTRNYMVQIHNIFNNGRGMTPISVASLSKIRNVKLLNEEGESPTEEEKVVMERLMANGVEFYPEKENYIIKVKLSEQAIDLFNRRAYNRPSPVAIDGDIYTFDCKFYQFKVYFLGFIYPYEILEPVELIDVLKVYYEDKINMLERNKKKN